jgi:hypothetical protein
MERKKWFEIIHDEEWGLIELMRMSSKSYAIGITFIILFSLFFTISE